jgi:DNA polymerase II small subunit/DNA polymerase delta subunit B
MTEYTGRPPSPEAASESGAKVQAKQAAGTVAEEGKHVTGVARDEAGHVSSEAKQQASKLMDDLKSQLNEQSRKQCDKIADGLRTFSQNLKEMASKSEHSGLATDIAREVADKTESLSSQIEGRDATELLEDIRHFARNRPGTFLLGAAVTGMVTGRLSRSAKAGSSHAAPASRGDNPAASKVPPMSGVDVAPGHVQVPPASGTALGEPASVEHPARGGL